ncbi:MAG: hypothetical protein IKG95_07980 [Bacteroidales bacterium]|nr:hypothetical protein [Bacteroidales bacterium]
MMKIHIGEMIRRELKAQGRTMTWFANAIHSDRSNAYKMLKRDSIDLALLNKICQLLHHDFFRDCSDALRSNAQPWTGSDPAGEQDF